MATLALSDPRKTWKVNHWTLPAYNEWIFLVANQTSGISNLQSRFATWGLEYGIFSMTVWHKYYPTSIRLSWQDQHVGNISIEEILPPSKMQTVPNGTPDSSPGLPSLPSDTGLSSSSKNITSFSDLGESFQVFYNYDGADLVGSDVFITIVSALRICADEGADRRCPELEFTGWDQCAFSLTSEKDRYGNSLLKYRHVVKMLQRLAFIMVERKNFAEMTFVLEVNGVKTAEGRFLKEGLREISR